MIMRLFKKWHELLKKADLKQLFYMSNQIPVLQ